MEGQVDVVDAFSTVGRIDQYDLLVLKDDKRFFPLYDAAFLIRNPVVEKYPAVREALEELAGKISNEEMRRLNFRVTHKKRPERDVAREFLVSKGLFSE